MLMRVGIFILTNVLVIAAMTAILGLARYLGYGPLIDQYVSGYTGLFAMCLLWGMVGSFISLSISKWAAKRMTGLEIVSPTGSYGEIVRKIHEISRKAGLEKMPEVGVYDSPEVNAFATGPSRNNALVAVSTGLLRKMNQDEVEGVLAHEVAHIANGDMITMALVQGVINAFVMFLARVVMTIIDNASRDENGRGGLGFFAYFFIVQILQAFFGFMAMPLVMWFSRWREFRADSGSSQLVGKHKMIAALEALKRDYPSLSEGKGQEAQIQTMSISAKEGFTSLFSSHPSLDQRIQALKNA